MIPSAIDENHVESYYNMWKKTQSIWNYIGQNHMNTFDWFLLGGDDMYVIVENLRYYFYDLESLIGQETPMYLGRPLRSTFRHVYNNGGAGYLLNRPALELLIFSFQQRSCLSSITHSIEDVLVGYCLSNLGVFALNTQDDLGRERFHWRPPHIEYRAIETTYLSPANEKRKGLPVKRGYNSFSPGSIGFQFESKLFMYCFNKELYEVSNASHQMLHRTGV